MGQHVVAMRDRFLTGVDHAAAPVALDGRLDKLGAQLARIARRGGALLEVKVHDALQVTADAHELERAITNVVRNAVRFSPPGGRVVLSLRRVGRTAVLEVADDGPGIPADQVTSIFQRGVRGRTDDTGHGLGLAIAWRVVQAHGGSISCANRTEGGAIFTIALPLA